MKKMSSYKLSIFFILGLSLFFGGDAHAEDVFELEATELKSNIPPPPNFDLITNLGDLDKAIKIELDESFVPKIISSMKKEPF